MRLHVLRTELLAFINFMKLVFHATYAEAKSPSSSQKQNVWFIASADISVSHFCIYVISTLDTLFWSRRRVVATRLVRSHAALYTQHGTPRAADGLFI